MNRILGLVTTLFLGSLSFAHAHSVTVGTMEIIHPAIPAPPAGAKSAAGYLEIVNAGDAADRLLGVETAIAKRAMLHATDHGADGVARMIHLDAIDIPAGGTVLLEPGGLHIMLMGLTGPLTEGDMIPATLVFERAGRVAIEFSVDAPAGTDHSRMDHSAAGHQTAPTGHGHAGGTDADQIEAVLMAQFDSPEAPLTVSPITIQGPVAVAGWSQQGKGGRAFLRKDDMGWFVELCAGESLVQPATFVSMGLTRAGAESLAAAVNGAELSAGADLIGRLNAFEGTVLVGRSAADGHGHGAGQTD
ncbi:MAG: copper chaperone PCu(A)C [Rhodobacter sp.]|nr:copper chaperone PCu(A)C [Rhodobacter sp.]MCA3512457.1 copper chaperone PCu(A)C [Rhodobacter sp.]MCA3519452.1 copper chaperone PCu(A)C [Rhodobacter sp.]MCA3523316.1 copper chaperone PCu(A)C [Rhodobacter sp.]MCA3529065.1 copper chaperone PCu(A)C [Rhodobacter sp.]